MSADWETIRKENAPQMWSIAWRILKHEADALDCCQEVFTEAFTVTTAKSNQQKRDPIQCWSAYLKWLTTRRAIDFLRRKKRLSQPKLLGETDILQADESGSVESQMQFDELSDWVKTELTQMPEQMATAFWLVCVEELSYLEVADQIGITVNSVGVQVHRAREKLKQQMKKQPSSRT